MPDPIATPPVTFADIEAAAGRLEGIAHRTPVMTSRTADAMADGKLFFKCENLQRGGAFKFRGAYNAIATLTEDQRRHGVIAYSSGNHAQAVAYAGRLQGVTTTIVMPKDAPAAKVSATREYGGEVIFYDRYTESREEICAALAANRGLTVIPPYDHPQVIAGAGTAARELFKSVGELDVLLVCLGGGGLLAGSALSAKALSPRCRVIGVEPEAGNDGQQSFRAGHVIRIPVPRSIADGALTTYLGANNFPIIRGLVHDIVTVSDQMLIDAMKFFAERMKIIVEPTGCLAAAAALSKRFHQSAERVGVVLSGGNIDLPRYAQLLR
ncbi:MAG TPA: threo-3-hydroxy-L-aspartate ammonia-lyase [Steroidobacteraceae bacterium]|jgi:threonine dehydratase|nr:threo-3-hydroxy-L-aspartate ammonia-lyase [Steroidobacteraceae bacterium]